MLNESFTKPEGMTMYSSLSNFKKDNQSDNKSVALNNDLDQTSISSEPKDINDFETYPYLYDYGPTEETYTFQHPPKPEVNIKTVIGGIAAILLGKTKGLGSIPSPQKSSSSVSFLGPEENGISFLNQSVCVPNALSAPSAPPMLDQFSFDHIKYRQVLDAEPSEWLPDSSTTVCTQCSSPFTALTRGRHHCRFCGHVFCRTCTKGRCLLPVKFRTRDPQRVCDYCYDLLDPVQHVLKYTISNAAQSAKHDVMDWTCGRGWLNLPVGLSMEYEIYKAANTLINYCQVARLNPEKSIPQAVLKGASGLAILTAVKVGALITYKLGTGLVVSKRLDGSWSAPSAIVSAGLGWGPQFGGELTDFIIVLRGSETVKTFSSRMHFSVGAGLSAAAGPVGRVFEADVRSGERGSGMCYTYSCSKGAFVGVSLEGSIFATRMDTNLRFYGDPYITTTDILLGTVERPVAAQPLYSALENLCSNFGC